MSDNVKNPFQTRKAIPSDNIFGFGSVTELVDSGKAVAGIFEETVTPEKQQAKASLWRDMIETFLSNAQMNGEQLAEMYYDKLPFRQKKTKRNFVKNNLIGKSRASIINHLLDKINDERIKGGFSRTSKAQILTDMGLAPVEIEKITKQKPRGILSKIGKPAANGIKLPTASAQPDPAYYKVIPLRPTMEMSLKTRGVVPSKNIEVLTNQFYNEIVRYNQPNNFAGQNELPPINTFDYGADYADEAKDAIITAVITYVRALKETAQTGGELSGTEQIIVRGAQKAEGIIQQKVKDEAAQKVGTDILFGGKWVWILGGVIALILVIALIMRK